MLRVFRQSFVEPVATIKLGTLSISLWRRPPYRSSWRVNLYRGNLKGLMSISTGSWLTLLMTPFTSSQVREKIRKVSNG